MTPEGLSTLGDVALSIRNGLFAKRPTDEAVGTPVLRISAVRDGRVDLADRKFVAGLTSDEVAKFSLNEDDLLITRYNGSRRLVGICGRVGRHPGPVIPPDKLIRVTVDRERALPQFVNLQMQSPFVRAFLEPRIRTTAGQSGISGVDVRAIPLWFPSLPEQQRIVDVLEDHLSRLDAAVATTKAASRRVGVLTSAWLASHTQISQAERLPLADLLESPLRHGRSVPTADTGFPVLRLTALQSPRADLSQRKIGAWTASDAEPFMVEVDDFLVARGSGSLHLVGRGALVESLYDPVAFPDTAIRVRVARGRMNPSFLALVWNGPAVRNQIATLARTTAGIHKINQTDLRRILLPVPSLEAQRALVHDADEIAVREDHLRQSVQLAEKRANMLRQSLLDAAFSGQL